MEGNGMDRRDFLKTTLVAGAGLAMSGSMASLAFGASSGNDLLAQKPLFELAGMLRKGEVTSTQLVQLYLDRIERFGGQNGLNAYITLAREAALKQAARLDAMASKKKFMGPLHGLPIAVKDNLDTKNIRTTGGTKILADWTPSANAFVVDKLQKAGAIILGKTNMHEFAFGITSNNPFYGPVRNPYDRTRIPGGSSGGSAAAAAAGFCAGAIGTDTGGSVRIPASLCNLVGLKPTLGRVGRGGLMYLSFTRDVIGSLTRTVMDSAMLLQAIAGPDPRDPESSSRAVPDYMNAAKGSLKGKRFGVPRKYFFEGIHPNTRNVIDESIKEIVKLGGVVKEVEVKHMDIATPTGFAIVLAESVYLIENYLKAFNPKATIGEYLNQMGPDVSAVLGGQIGTPESKPVPGYAYAKAVREDRNKMISGFEGAMQGVDALLLPTTPLPAAKIGEDVETDLNGKKVNTFLTFIKDCDPISVVGYPAITVPAGYSSGGLPIGLQIVARPFEEQKLLQMAHSFEQATKVWKPPQL
jgi:Asp-tRNA(Asn)/Glu-tRNA(Gln) amidotransferase A subunit family amidase